MGDVPLADTSQRVSKIFVGGLSPEVTDASFKEYFSQFGTITDSTVRPRLGIGRRTPFF